MANEVNATYFSHISDNMTEAVILDTVPNQSYQIYSCNNEGKFALKNPQAELENIRIGGVCGNSQYSGTHFFDHQAPTWVVFDNKGHEMGRVMALVKSKGPAPDPQTVPPVELEVIYSTGIFVGVTKVWRIETSGGAAPQMSCSPHQEHISGYGAKYLFLRPLGKNS